MYPPCTPIPQFECFGVPGLGQNQNLRAAIAQKLIALHRKWIPVAIGIGLALSPDFGSSEVDEIVQEADAVLSAAKQGGKNCAARRGDGRAVVEDADAATKAEVTLRTK